MNKKGFTLIEIIGVITVLALILIVAVPTLTRTLKRNEQSKYNNYIDNLKIAAESYLVNQLKEGQIFEADKDYTYVSLGDLIDAGYVKESITNPSNDGKLSRDAKVKVIKELDGTFKYDFYEHYILPDEYQQVEYLKNTDKQYINTGYKPNQNTAIEIYGNQVYQYNNSLFGVNPYFVITSSNAKYLFRYNNTVINTTIDSNIPAKLTLAKNKAYIDDNLIGTFDEGQFQTEYDALLFARISSSGVVEENNESIIYYAKIWDDDVLVRDFISVYRKKDGEIGLFDLVTYEFYTNAGTGEFEKGPAV